jgi:hypothetical protein
MPSRTLRVVLIVGLWAVASAVAPVFLAGQQRGGVPKAPEPAPPAAQTAVERLGPTLYRVGPIQVDVARREIAVPGKVNPDVRTLEFIANARDGLRAYETALTVDTDAITFNTALLLIGLDRTRSRNVPTAHFDPAVPEGDLVEIFVECPGRECQRMPAERLMFDVGSKRSPEGGAWVYTGSSFLPDGRYLAQTDGSLVGFVHDPASIIEYSVGAGLNRYGSIVFNTNVGLAPGTVVTMTVRALSPPRAR